jgi:predicted SnoaL-like aldol condensation-catalyzing enzyme
MNKSFIAISIALLCAPLFAQEPVTWSNDPEKLFTSKDKKLNTNKQAVMHNITSGLDSVMKFFGNNPNRPKTAIPGSKAWKSRIVAVTAEDDLVVVAWQRELENPRKPGTKYSTTWFDMWRMQDGKADEHWDYGTIAPPAANGK